MGIGWFYIVMNVLYFNTLIKKSKEGPNNAENNGQIPGGGGGGGGQIKTAQVSSP